MGQTTSDWERGEMNGDGTVNTLDYDIYVTNNGASPTASLTAAQEWGLDALGNWADYQVNNNPDEDSDFTDAGDLDQDRLHNKVNELDSDDDHLPDPIDPDTITEGGGQSAWVVPGYDAAGNMASGPKPGNETVRQHYVWDAWNRLVQVKADDNGSPGDLVVTYRYDGLHRRIQKLLGTDPEDPDTAYDYYYSGYQVVEVRKDGSEHPYKQYVWGLRYVHSPVLRWRDENTDGEDVETLYYTNDANFNVTALVEPDGDVVERVVYDPYGQPTFYDGSWENRSNTSAFDNAILFTGHRLDTETGLYYAGARYYHPTLGCWPSRDPGGYGDGMNLYEYVSSAPLHTLDPHGLLNLLPEYSNVSDALRAWREPDQRRQQQEYARRRNAERERKEYPRGREAGQRGSWNPPDERNFSKRFDEMANQRTKAAGEVENLLQPMRNEGDPFKCKDGREARLHLEEEEPAEESDTAPAIVRALNTHAKCAVVLYYGHWSPDTVNQITDYADNSPKFGDPSVATYFGATTCRGKDFINPASKKGYRTVPGTSRGTESTDINTSPGRFRNMVMEGIKKCKQMACEKPCECKCTIVIIYGGSI